MLQQFSQLLQTIDFSFNSFVCPGQFQTHAKLMSSALGTTCNARGSKSEIISTWKVTNCYDCEQGSRRHERGTLIISLKWGKAGRQAF